MMNDISLGKYVEAKHILQQWFFTSSKQKDLLQDIVTLLAEDIPINQVITVLLNTTRSHLNKQVLRDVQQKIAEGKPMADGMLHWFPTNIIEVVRAGEMGGTLVQSLHVAINISSQKNDTVSVIINALAYPLLVLFAGMVLAVFLKQTIFTDFAAIQPLERWPVNGQYAYHLATLLQKGWWLVLLVILLMAWLYVWSLKDYIGQFRSTLDKTLPFSLYRRITAAHFMETLGLLMSNGVLMKNALKIVKQNASLYLASHLLRMEYHLSMGRDNIAEVLDTGLLDAVDLERLRVIAQGRGFEVALIRQGKQALQKAMQDIQLTGKFAGGVILVLGAMWAAFLIFAIYGVGSILGLQ